MTGIDESTVTKPSPIFRSKLWIDPALPLPSHKQAVETPTSRTETTVELFGISFSNLSLEEACDRIAARVCHRTPGYIVTPNVNHVCHCHRNSDFRAAYDEAFMVLTDGVPLMWASWLLGKPLRKKMSGSDMLPVLCRLAAERGFTTYFLGGTPGAAEETARRMLERYPNLRVAGTDCPPVGFESNPEQHEAVLSRIRAAQPDICFVALGSPKQELWMKRHCAHAGATVYMGVGGTFEFIAGRVKRAPGWVQRAGFEWLWRLAMEPRRLWRRYLVDDVVFFRLLLREIRRSRRVGVASAPSVHR